MDTMVVVVMKPTYEVTKDPEVQFFNWSKAVETLFVMTTNLKMWCNKSLLATSSGMVSGVRCLIF